MWIHDHARLVMTLNVLFFRSRRYPDLNKLEAELESAREEKLRAKKKRKLAAADKAADSMSSDGYDTDSTVASGLATNPIFYSSPLFLKHHLFDWR